MDPQESWQAQPRWDHSRILSWPKYIPSSSPWIPLTKLISLLTRNWYTPYSRYTSHTHPWMGYIHWTFPQGTNNYWNSWIRQSTYNGAWKEAVHRSALALKLLIYEPTGTLVFLPCILGGAPFFIRTDECRSYRGESDFQSARVYRWN